jgi:membrane fusion protein (multidrug efflux system)
MGNASPRDQQAGTLATARARLRDATAAVEEARVEVARREEAFAQGHIPRRDIEDAQKLLDEFVSTEAARALAVGRLERDARARRSAQGGDSSPGETELTVRLEAARNELARIDAELARRRIVAPADGEIGEFAALAAGTWVTAGTSLGVIIPDGLLHVVGSFAPSDALGKVAVGQKARVRLAGFPATEYGALVARVTRVGSESLDGRVRVELALRGEPSRASRAPLRHGLPASIEVEVERVRPIVLLLRSAGRWTTADQAGR